MTIKGRVQNGVIILEEGVTLPEGTTVTVSYDLVRSTQPGAGKRIEFPLVRSKHPGTLQLTGQGVAELLEEEDVSS
jgi:hypothetical protein